MIRRWFFYLIIAGALLGALALPAGSASAHQSFPAGPYTIEIGWLNEPSVAGQPNAIVVNVSGAGQGMAGMNMGTAQPTSPATAPTSPAGTPGAAAVIDASGLVLNVFYGGQTKQLTLVPQAEDTPDNLMGVMTPSIQGKYTITLSGTLTGGSGPASVSISTQPEEVVGIEEVQFPSASAGSSAVAAGSAPAWLGYAGLAAGILGILLAVIALLRK
ncbi:MAG TPA: hypothetical protein VF813_09450 [Anaerolineaceae bacterium]